MDIYFFVFRLGEKFIKQNLVCYSGGGS